MKMSPFSLYSVMTSFTVQTISMGEYIGFLYMEKLLLVLCQRLENYSEVTMSKMKCVKISELTNLEMVTSK